MSQDDQTSEVEPPPEDMPAFDVVLRGYDRRQVEDYVLAMHGTLAELRLRLAEAEDALEWSVEDDQDAAPEAAEATPQPPAVPEQRMPVPFPRSVAPPPEDELIAFSDRLQAILRTAREEAQAIRAEARESAQAEQVEARRHLEALTGRRDAVLGELTRVRSTLDDLVRTDHAPAPGAERNGVPPES